MFDMNKLIEHISAVVVFLVVAAVLFGFLRLAIENWGYVLLLLGGAGAAAHLYKQSK